MEEAGGAAPIMEESSAPPPLQEPAAVDAPGEVMQQQLLPPFPIRPGAHVPSLPALSQLYSEDEQQRWRANLEWIKAADVNQLIAPDGVPLHDGSLPHVVYPELGDLLQKQFSLMYSVDSVERGAGLALAALTPRLLFGLLTNSDRRTHHLTATELQRRISRWKRAEWCAMLREHTAAAHAIFAQRRSAHEGVAAAAAPPQNNGQSAAAAAAPAVTEGAACGPAVSDPAGVLQQEQDADSASTAAAAAEQDRRAERKKERVLKLVHAGELSRASRHLSSDVDPAPRGQATFEKLRLLHPPAASSCELLVAEEDSGDSDASQQQQPSPIVLSKESVEFSLRTASKRSAPGPTGWTAEMLYPLLSHQAALDSYVVVLNVVAAGGFSAEEIAPFATSNLVGLGKPGGTGVRPIGMGDVLIRRTALRAAVQQQKALARATLTPSQLGLAVGNGVETAARALQLHLEQHPDHLLLTLDISNAFNSLSRVAARRRLRQGPFSSLCSLFDSFYGQPNALWVEMEPGEPPRCFHAEDGTTQGCPLASLVFDSTIHPELKAAAEMLQQHEGGMAIGIHDDIHLVGPPEPTIAAFRRLKHDLKQSCNLNVKPSKTRALTLSGQVDAATLAARLDCPADSALPICRDSSVPVERRGLIIVGAPVGTPEYVAAEMLRLAETTAAHLPQRIATSLADHFHEGQQLLRMCSVASMMFLSRAVPTTLAVPAQRLFDAANVDCMMSLLRAGGSLVAGSSAYRQIQLPLSGGMGGLGVTSLEAVGPAAHVASVQASLGLLEQLNQNLTIGFGARLPVSQDDLPSLDVPAGAAALSLAFYRHDLTELPVASYRSLRDGEESARRHGGKTAEGHVTAAAAATSEQSDGRGLQHRLTQPIMRREFKRFLQQLEAECAGVEGLLEMARAQHRSFAGGGAAFMDSFTAPAGMLSWHARFFLRSALRILPDELLPGAVWTCPRAYCQKRRTGLGAIAHASCERGASRRHNAFLDGIADVLRAFPGHPELRIEVQGIPAEGCRMDVVVDGAWTGSAGAPGAAPDRRRLLVDASVVEPMSVEALEKHHSWRSDGAATAASVKEKVERYDSLIADRSRCRLLPLGVETWGRLSEPFLDVLKGTALLAARRECGRDSCSSDAAESRRDARLSAVILRGWIQRISAAIAVAEAEELDRLFHPLRGSMGRQAYARFAPRGGVSGGVDNGVVGCTAHVRNAAPRYVSFDVF